MSTTNMRDMITILEDESDIKTDNEIRICNIASPIITQAGFDIENDGHHYYIMCEDGNVIVDLEVPIGGFTLSHLNQLNSLNIVDGEIKIDSSRHSTSIEVTFKYKDPT